MQEKMQQYQNALDTMSSEATEYVRGIPVVKTFGQTVHSFRRFKGAIDGYGKWTTDYTLMLRWPMTAFMTCINAIFVFIVICAFAFSKDGITAGLILNIMYYIIVTPLITVALTKVAYSGEAEMTLIDALKRVESIMEIEPLADNKAGQLPKDHSVELKNVTYRYKDAARDAVKNVSIRIAPGEHVALVGPSGSGKTTLAELIVRFFDVSQGEILIGGVNVKDIPSNELMKRVSFVFQDSRLIKKSIFENVRMAKPDAGEDEVLAALKTAQCMDIIEKLPDGIHTVIGEKGTYLSGGEQQRITIARAFLKDAPVILLDEATASLDAENETAIQEALSRLISNKTVMIIAHRMRTIANADNIVVLKDGVVAEQGSPGFLSSYDSIYSHMTKQQMISQSWKM